MTGNLINWKIRNMTCNGSYSYIMKNKVVCVHVCVCLLKELHLLALQNLKVEYKRKGRGQLLHEQVRKYPKSLGFDLGATHSLGKCEDPRPYQLW